MYVSGVHWYPGTSTVMFHILLPMVYSETCTASIYTIFSWIIKGHCNHNNNKPLPISSYLTHFFPHYAKETVYI